MLKQFYINFIDREIDPSGSIKHIQYNYIKRLNKLKYITHRRIDIYLVTDTSSPYQETGITLDDGKRARLELVINPSLIEDLTSTAAIVVIYQLVLQGLTELWKKNKWNYEDVVAIGKDIEQENYFVSVRLGKTFVSPDRKKKAKLYCEIFPTHADYYLEVTDKKGSPKRSTPFLKGTPIIDLFFTFFNKQYWRDDEHFIIHDLNTEIFYVFYTSGDTFSIEYRPLHNTQEQLENYVKAHRFDVSRDESLRLLGMKP